MPNSYNDIRKYGLKWLDYKQDNKSENITISKEDYELIYKQSPFLVQNIARLLDLPKPKCAEHVVTIESFFRVRVEYLIYPNENEILSKGIFKALDYETSHRWIKARYIKNYYLKNLVKYLKRNEIIRGRNGGFAPGHIIPLTTPLPLNMASESYKSFLQKIEFSTRVENQQRLNQHDYIYL